MLLVYLLASLLCGSRCVPVGNQELADSLKWSTDSVQADLRAVQELRLERFFRIDEYSECVILKETELLNVAVDGLTAAVGKVRGNEAAYSTVMALLEVLDGNGRMVVESSEDVDGLIRFKGRFGDILSMSLGYPGEHNFAMRVETVRKNVPKLSNDLERVKEIPTTMLEKFDSFASAEHCAANIRK